MTDHDMKYLSAEIKEVGEHGTFTGLISMYDVEDLGGDVIDKGAFTQTIERNPEVLVLWQHKSDEVIGRGTVKEWGSKVTINAKLDLTDPTAQKAYDKMKAGLIKGLSIGFTTIKATWETVQDRMIRHITELKLWEVSVVTFPMLEAAQVTRVKSADEDANAARLAQLEKQVQALQDSKSPPADTHQGEPRESKEPPSTTAKPLGEPLSAAVLQCVNALKNFTFRS